ncbi:MAG: type II toxin-antitoxin system RelE/ParE family toxin [Sulfuricaulis sp.]|uniref:type II toxin-antitoxin system RelE/ParE family toxin n=1 Tax=Sulfuricaulis sp. TaxID=2003553 RepID=UPI0034A5501D
MNLYKTKWFHRWAAREGLTDAALWTAVMELEQGLADALGGNVYKKRIGLPGRGKRGSVRTLIAFRQGERAFFMYGYPKNERANISNDDLKALRLLAKELLGYNEQGLAKAVKAGELIEVNDDGKT